ncbi:porin family protein [Emticicia soli]|uniref:Porin family protein n=1 Tax=Emticicia soli TaxID=2027878 RepID=A0ABW5JEK9_9BACT
MRALFTFLILSISLSSATFAQDFRIAPVVGVGVTSVLNSDKIKNAYNQYGSILGLDVKHRPAIKANFGVWADYSFNEKMAFRSGLLISFKGETVTMNYNEYGESGSGKVKQKLTYLELPLMLNYKIGDSGMKLLFGPSINFALSAKATGSYSLDGEFGGTETEVIEIGSDPRRHEVMPVDFALNLGIAKDFGSSDRPLEVSLMVSPSLTPYTTYTKSDPQSHARHLAIGLRAAYFFSINK